MQGCSDSGCVNDDLPGYQPEDDPRVAAKFSKAWGTELSSTTGLDNHTIRLSSTTWRSSMTSTLSASSPRGAPRVRVGRWDLSQILNERLGTVRSRPAPIDPAAGRCARFACQTPLAQHIPYSPTPGAFDS